MPHRVPESEHIGWRIREETEGVQALGKLKYALRREKSISGLESSYTTKGSGSQHGPAGLSSNRKRNHSGSNRSRGSAGTSARRVFQISRVTGRRRRHVRECRAIGFAKQNCTMPAQFSNDRSIIGADSPFINRRTVCRGQAPRLNNVFDSKRDAGKIAGSRWFLRLNLDPCVNRWIRRADAIEAGW